MSKTYPADPRCQGCYYVEKVNRQTTAICASQNANALYKTRLKALAARVVQLEEENRRLLQAKARYSKLARENTTLKRQVKELSTDLAEAYDAIGILNRRVMEYEQHVRRDS